MQLQLSFSLTSSFSFVFVFFLVRSLSLRSLLISRQREHGEEQIEEQHSGMRYLASEEQRLAPHADFEMINPFDRAFAFLSLLLRVYFP